MHSTEFKFPLKQQVVITCSNETGQVIGRAEHSASSGPSYLIRYRAADGRAIEAWWTEDALRETQASAREPYQRAPSSCPDSASRPNSTANATTEASL